MLSSDGGTNGDCGSAARTRTDAVGGMPAGPPRVPDAPSLDRRRLLRWAGTAAVAAPAAGLLAACGGSSSSASAARKVRIGYVLPRTGTLDAYSAVDSFIVTRMRRLLADGIKVGGRTYPVEILVRDSQSDRHRAGIATADLIYKDHVDLVLAGGTSDTAIPVADQCEINQVPCISSVAPWQSWWNGRGGNVDMPFHWTYHFYTGLEDIVSAYVAMWRQLGITKVGLVYTADDDGGAFANQDFGIPSVQNFGFRVTSPREGFDTGTTDFGAYASAFDSAGVEAVVGVMPTADFDAFQRTIRNGTFTPKAMTFSKALDFQEDVRTFGSNGDGLTTEIGWSPSHPYRSSLDNRAAKDLATDFIGSTGRVWTPVLGFVNALFEVAVKALGGAESLEREAIVAAIREVDAQTIVGPVAFGSQPNVPKNVAQVAAVGGQWAQADNDLKLQIVNNSGNSRIPTDGQLRQLPSGTA
ncbi:ABC transporter substrate-binding protein [Frankia sp. Ag45/Mut15]|uniref:ABC transporter substrate-binding protein n=1 Tax=Frankia umida TaxID=573489 RepID=A0ABT0JTM9_9ACTN|nr:ABC transporter substrate-binding protein [Frankia umida]MCK9874898.1 ABC transporter substrate-binding protein [Frankia umida]